MAKSRKPNRPRFTLDDLLDARILNMRAENAAPTTILLCSQVVTDLRDFLMENGLPTDGGALRKKDIQTFLARLLSEPCAKGCPCLQPRWTSDSAPSVPSFGGR